MRSLALKSAINGIIRQRCHLPNTPAMTVYCIAGCLYPTRYSYNTLALLWFAEYEFCAHQGLLQVVNRLQAT